MGRSSLRFVLSLLSCAVSVFPLLCALDCSSMQGKGHRRWRDKSPSRCVVHPHAPVQDRPCLRTICNRSAGRYFGTPALHHLVSLAALSKALCNGRIDANYRIAKSSDHASASIILDHFLWLCGALTKYKGQKVWQLCICWSNWHLVQVGLVPNIGSKSRHLRVSHIWHGKA